MNTTSLKAIEDKIQAAVQYEQTTGHFASFLGELSAKNGTRLSTAQITDVIDWVMLYVEQVPAIMSTAKRVGIESGMSTQVNALLETAALYWALPEDIIPDHLGLEGIVDDAYFTLSVLQAASEMYCSSKAVPLFEQNFCAMNSSIRDLIGEPCATQLDNLVAQTTGQPTLMQTLTALYSNPTFPSYTPMAIPDHDVDCRLAELGVFF